MNSELKVKAEELLAKLDGLDEFSSKRMFGGYGLFHAGKMFGIIDSKGKVFFKADEALKQERQAKGAVQHSRMPYYSVPETVFQQQDVLIKWARESIQASK